MTPSHAAVAPATPPADVPVPSAAPGLTPAPEGPAPAASPQETEQGEVQVVVCPNGPLLLRGDVRLVDADGKDIPRRRRTVALCRCGATGMAPFCDGSHKLVHGAR
ncbi:MAG: CDGSH iron-sulfur domain-containing protein [Kineosporiaceae bacterium]